MRHAIVAPVRTRQIRNGNIGTPAHPAVVIVRAQWEARRA
jgi:hypothetical protein